MSILKILIVVTDTDALIKELLEEFIETAFE